MDGLLKGYEFFKQFNNILGFTGEGKKYEILVREFRGEELDFLLSVLDSRYVADGAHTNYAGLLKSFCHEAARLKIGLLQVKFDLFYAETRGEYLNQNLAEFLFTGEKFPGQGFDDESFRTFLLSILKAYLGGSTKSNMEEALTIFSNLVITLKENVQRSLDDDTYYDISDQFKFLVEVEVEGSGLDFQELQDNFNFILNLIKPAHTNQLVRFIFKEVFEFGDGGGGGCKYILDEFGDMILDDKGWPLQEKLTPTSICDQDKIYYLDYHYDDIRKICQLEQEEICVEKEDVTTQPSVRPVYVFDADNIKIPVPQDPRDYHTRFGPFTDGSGAGIVTYDIAHVTAFINGIEVDIEETYPLSATIRLKYAPSIGDTIEISYCYFKNPTIGITYNDPDRVLNSNGSDYLTEFQYSSVISPISNQDGAEEDIGEPLEHEYKYSAYELTQSSLLNCPINLVLNKTDSLRHRFNDSWLMKSWGYDDGEYNTKLNCTTPIFPYRLQYGNSFVLTGEEEFKLNDINSELNIVIDKFYDPDIHTKQKLYDELEKYYGGLRVMERNNGGNCDLLKPICEGPMNISQSFTADPTSIYYKKEMPTGILYYNTPSTVLNDDIIWAKRAIESEWSLDLGTIEDNAENVLSLDELQDNVNILETDYKLKGCQFVNNNPNHEFNNGQCVVSTKWEIIDRFFYEEKYEFDDQFEEVDDDYLHTIEMALDDRIETQDILDIPTYWTFFFKDQKGPDWLELNNPMRTMNSYDPFFISSIPPALNPPPWFIASMIGVMFNFTEDVTGTIEELKHTIHETEKYVEENFKEINSQLLTESSYTFLEQRSQIEPLLLNDAPSNMNTSDILYIPGVLPLKPWFTSASRSTQDNDYYDLFESNDIDDESGVFMTITTAGVPTNYQLTGKTWQVI